MVKKLINSKREYLEHCFPICNREKIYAINNAYGLILIMDCYDHDDNNNMLDEEGNIIPPDSVDNVKVEEWVDELTYPLMLLEWIENDSDRVGNYSTICVETVCLKEFEK
jgi:hypothetical protein